ncbi:putative non-LTR retroelement reverse transcriptase [Trifolium medium]|uniref:Putative non-LTR retroelement reverse transcriptase n=1 Tax=Trifolium medium TaxID=97028 RepID=A0A392QJP4_9FABA|nr:putative non-LTR retroelement reverse transcriptase [Trifolium medium]
MHIGWNPPPEGWVKLNTDGSCSDGGWIGCGGVLRGSHGEWLGGFANFIGQGNAYLAELWGVFEGLKIARNLKFSAVELNVDSREVVNVIRGEGGGNLQGSALVYKIRRLLKKLDWEVVVHHSYREANQCADALANIGVSSRIRSRFFETCPTQLNHVFLADIMGITTPRLVTL